VVISEGAKMRIFNLFKKPTHCKVCRRKLREHGWKDQKDCLNSKCKKFYYREFEELK
jgi:hypothetical protein